MKKDKLFPISECQEHTDKQHSVKYDFVAPKQH